MTCWACQGKRYLVCLRDDGRKAVERCDACSPNLTDKQAAILAGGEGIRTVGTYPFIVKED